MKSIGVLLTCHNRKEKTLQCLQHLFVQPLPEDFGMDVYMVNDGCTDGTPEAVAELYPVVHIIPGSGNLYWNRGMHLAWATAAQRKEYDFYLWLNDDTMLFKNAINTLILATNDANSNSIFIGSTQSSISKEITYGGFDYNEKLIIPNSKLQKCSFFNGNCVFVPNSVFKLIGNLDPFFQHGFGDFDYGFRAQKKGIELIVAKHIVGYCEPHDTLPKWCDTKTPLLKRVIELYKPLGNNPFEFLLIDYRKNGLFISIFHFFSLNFHAISPKLYSKLK